MYIFLCPANTTIEQQLRWLFGLSPTAELEALKFFDAENSVSIGLAKAPKIEEKHLLTLQPSISESQTNEMKSERLQLIVPKSISHSYQQSQRDWLMDVAGFIDLVKTKQQASGDA